MIDEPLETFQLVLRLLAESRLPQALEEVILLALQLALVQSELMVELALGGRVVVVVVLDEQSPQAVAEISAASV